MRGAIRHWLPLAAILAPHAALALDCAKTATEVETAICADPALKALDSFNFDMTTGNDFHVSDFFPDSAVTSLVAHCRDQIVAEKVLQQQGDGAACDPATDLHLEESEFREAVTDLGHWRFTEDGLAIVFYPYKTAAYAEGYFDYTFPMADLHALAQPDAPLP